MKKVFLFLVTFLIFSLNITNGAYSNTVDENYKLQEKGEKLLEKYIEQISTENYDETSKEYKDIVEKGINLLENNLLKEGEKLLKKQDNDTYSIISSTDFDPLNNNEDFIIYSYYKLTNKYNNSLMKVSTYSTTSTYYNRTEAVDYAQEWALSRNPDYYDFGDNDCTNFASQSIHAGYIPFIVDGIFGKYDDDNWYYNYYNPSTDSSWTWVNADWFYSHLEERTERYSIESSYTYLGEGDLILIDWTGDGEIDHSTIITDKTGSTPSQIKLSYHSNNRLDKPLQDLFNDPTIPNAEYHYIKVIY